MKRIFTTVALIATCICSALAQTTESVSPTADLYVRMGSTSNNSAKTTIEMYTTRDDDGNITADFVGLMSFDIPQKVGYKVSKATLRLVTERAKGSINIYGFPYAVSNSDTYESQADNITAARATTALVSSLKLAGTNNKAVRDTGASSELSDWVNTIDLTAYAQSIGSGDMALLMENAANSTTTSVQVYTSDATDVENTNEGFTFAAADLVPVLTVEYEETVEQEITVGNYTLSTENYYVFTAGTRSGSGTEEDPYEYSEEEVEGYALAMTGTSNTQAIKYNYLTNADEQIWQLEYAGEQTVSTSADATETVNAFYLKNVGTGNYLYISEKEDGSYTAYPAFASSKETATNYMFYFAQDAGSADMLHIRAVVTVKESNYGRNIGHSNHSDGQNLSADNVGSSSNMWVVTEVESESTGIKEVSTARDSANKAYYTIDGIRVSNPTPGRLYIVGGKKVIF